jgi:hypothetical protein
MQKQQQRNALQIVEMRWHVEDHIAAIEERPAAETQKSNRFVSGNRRRKLRVKEGLERHRVSGIVAHRSQSLKRLHCCLQ